MLPPTIPTSFVPRSASAPRRSRADFGNAFSVLAYVVLGVVFVLAIGVFFYGRILAASQASKDAALAQSEAGIDPTTVENFIRLRDRLASGEALFSGHSAFSGFFTALGTLLPATVRFTSLDLSLDNNGTVQFQGSGIAKDFNALAFANAAFANDGRIKDAIFSHIVVNSDNTVSFALSASLDPKLVAFSPSSYATTPIVPTATTSSTSTTAP